MDSPSIGTLILAWGGRVEWSLLPVVTTKDRRPQLFRNVQEWRQVAEERGISFVQAAIEYEKDFSGWDDGRIWDYFEKIDAILRNQIHSLENVGYDRARDTPNLPIYGRAWDRYLKVGKALEDPITQHIIRSHLGQGQAPRRIPM